MISISCLLLNFSPNSKKTLAFWKSMPYNTILSGTKTDAMDGFPSGQRGQTVNLLSTTSKVRILLHPLMKFIFIYNLIIIIAGWSSLVARRAHNPEAACSSPASATMFIRCISFGCAVFFIQIMRKEY